MLVDVIPAKWRKLIYVVLAFVAAGVTIVAAELADGFQAEDVSAIILGLLAAGGFSMAASNTPAPTGNAVTVTSNPSSVTPWAPPNPDDRVEG